MAGDAKQRILDAALNLFSQNGYEGTNMRDLAQSLGLTKSALYKHYQSKEDIWNSLIDSVSEYYDRSIGTPGEGELDIYSFESLESVSMEMLAFTIYDEKMIRVRKLLLIEQFHDERTRNLATKYFLSRNQNLFSRVFGRMMDSGLLVPCDPDVLAFAFTTPIGALVQLSDREPGREEEVLERARIFIRHFIRTYGVGPCEGSGLDG